MSSNSPQNHLNLSAGKLVLLLVGWLIFCLPSISQSQHTTDTVTTTQTDPNTIPYETERTVGQHILAAPSYLFHWATWPVGYGFKFIEREFPELFFPKVPNSGIVPFFELGSKEAKVAYGIIAFNNNFLNDHNAIRFTGLFGSESYNSFELNFSNSEFLSGELELNAHYSNNPNQSLYGDNASLKDDRRIYAIENFGGQFAYDHSVSSIFNFGLKGSYKLLDINQGDLDDSPGGLFPSNLQGTSSLLIFGSSATFNFTRGMPRIYDGSRIKFGVDWGQSLNHSEYHFLRYTTEYNHFIPVPFLPETRRLAFKAHLRKTEPLAGGAVPFFEQPALGSNQDLRGYTGNRFRDDGSLLLTLEYRYPMWDFADVVLFVDEGQVFDSYSDIHINDFHADYGFGFHLITGRGFAFRTEFAFSKETSRVILSVTPNI